MSTQSTPAEDPTSVVRNLFRISSDDVRRPLWAIRTAAEILTRSPRLSPREQDIVALIARNAERVEETFRLLVDRAVASAGPGMPLEKERCSIADIVEEAIAIARSEHPDRTFRHGTPDGFGEWDRCRIVQLLASVLAHADAHGVVGAAAHLTSRAADDAVVFTVTLAPALRGADVAGLRLAIAREIARAHAGDLEIRHEPSGRLSISAWLPRDADRAS